MTNYLDFDGYESPISMEIRKIDEKIAEERDNQILVAVQEECQIKIDKFELMRALNYDRDQYNKGFEDAKKKFERLMGKWILVGDDVDDDDLAWFSCSKCDAVDKLDKNNIKAKYCWNCGADMRKEVEDD